jgi:pimeloyl-ACP methyl ester carboxylesterase
MADSRNVVLVHGIWMSGAIMLYLKIRMESEHGIKSRLFSYPSMLGSLDENAELLAECVREQGGPVHLVAHSLGGVIALRMLNENSQANVERVVCLGSPLSGSHAANDLSQYEWAQTLLGKTVAEGIVDGSASQWGAAVAERHDVGTVAGTVSIGIGKLVSSMEGPNDGVIRVAETRLTGAKDHIEMNVSHSGMLVSADVADQVAAFLKRGEFLRE